MTSPTVRTEPWLLFDGDCAFCTSSVDWLSDRMEAPGASQPRRVPWQFVNLAELGTTEERARREVLWLTPTGEIMGGASAFAAWLQYRGGAYGGLGRLLAAPGVRTLAAAVYRLVANNRDKMPGGSPACALPPPGFDPSQPGRQSL